MGYTINLIQDVATGGIWNGGKFVEILTQDDYANALFIEGDPESIPDNFAGLKPGEYRIMTFLTQNGFPTVNNNSFFNFAGQPVANAVDVTFNGGSAVILNPQSPFDEAGSLGAVLWILFTEQQIFDFNLIEAIPVIQLYGYQYPDLVNLFAMQVALGSKGGYFSSGFPLNGVLAGPIPAQYLFVY